MMSEEHDRLWNEPLTPVTFSELGMPFYDTEEDVLPVNCGVGRRRSLTSTRNAGNLAW